MIDMTAIDTTAWEYTHGPDCTARELAHLAASLAEGFCPAGHRLAVGNGRFGTCHICQMCWTAFEHSYHWSAITGPDRRVRCIGVRA